MLPSERRKKILDLLSKNEVVTIPVFMDEFDISIETLRRDLTHLEKQGKIEKVYGGAKIKKTMFGEPEMESRMIGRIVQKEAIGRKCSDFISNGDCIFIDSGSTAYQVSKHLEGKKNLVVVTNSIPVVNELINTDFEIIITGGRVRHSERSIVTYEYMFNFGQLNIQKSFIGAGGITFKNGISDFNMQEAITRKNIIERSSEVFVTADSSKFGRDVTINIAPLEKIDFIVTDSEIDKNQIKNFETCGTSIVIAD